MTLTEFIRRLSRHVDDCVGNCVNREELSNFLRSALSEAKYDDTHGPTQPPKEDLDDQ